MSEPSKIFEFQELEDDLDIDAIFGTNGTSPDRPPAAQPQSANAGGTQEPIDNNTASPEAPHCGQSNAKELSTPEEELDLFSVFSDEKAGSDSKVPAKTEKTPSEEKTISLFDKLPIFSYGGAREKIEDTSMTFEELRIRKADDFPELEEGKKVSWTVKYGDVSKAVSLPKETTIAKIKEEIERSKVFLDSLKKGKVKDPDCLVTPKVTAGSKGIAAYKGVYPTVEAARKSDKVICLIPAADGRLYEMRKTEMGEFIVPANNVVEFSEVRAGFQPALPRIPQKLMGQVISLFRSLISGRQELEAVALIYWDREKKEFLLHIPRQTASKAHVGFQMDEDMPSEDRYLLYADIHSHNSMAATFSSEDDKDEKATRLYVVVGKLDQFYPRISARISCGGSYLEVDPSDVIEGIGEAFPEAWLKQIDRQRINVCCGKETVGSEDMIGAMLL